MKRNKTEFILENVELLRPTRDDATKESSLERLYALGAPIDQVVTFRPNNEYEMSFTYDKDLQRATYTFVKIEKS